jgi:anti-anti-sigma regulatory factor
MLKITIQSEPAPVQFRMEGRLAGAWVDEAQRAWTSLPVHKGVAPVVDLTGVTYVDAAGKALLTAMWREGADLRAAGCCTKFIVEEITERRPPTE